MSSPLRKKSKREEEVMRLPTDAPIDFTTLSHLTNQTFIVEGRKIYAGKDFLSLHSPFFHTMLFTSNFAEKDQNEIELKEVAYKDFLEILKMMYNPKRKIKDKYINSLLILGDRYDIKAIMDRVENHLIASDNYSKNKKRRLANQFRLIKLEAKITTEEEVPRERREKRKMDVRLMKSCEISKDEMERMNFITSGVFPSLFGLVYEDNVPFDIAGLLWEIELTSKKVGRKYQLSFDLIINDDQPSEINWSVEGIVEFEFALDNVERKGFAEYLYEMEKDPLYEDGVVVTRVYVKKLTGVRAIPQFDFTAPSPLSDATLIVGDKRLYVNKQYLSSISKVFRAIFDEDSSGMKSEFVLEDIEYHEFVELLHWIYPSSTKNFEGMQDGLEDFLDMAKDFGVSVIRHDIESYLNTTSSETFFLLPLKICLHFADKININVNNLVRVARRRFDEAEKNARPDWLFPLLKESRVYLNQPSRVKVKILEFIVGLRGETNW